MSGNDRNETLTGDFSSSCRKNAGDKIHSNFTRYSSLGSCVKGISFNSSTEGSTTCKRKLDDNNSSVDDKKRKELSASSTCVSPWEFRRLRADLIEAQAQIVKLEDRIDELHKKNKETVIFFDKEKNEMKLQIEINRNTVKDLEYRLHKVRKREAECREEFNERVKLLELEKIKLNDKILQLEHENTEIKAQYDQLKNTSESSLMSLQSEEKQLTEENERLKLNLEEKEELCHSLEERLSVAIEALRESEEAKEELHGMQLKLQELESERAEYEEARKLTITLSEKVLRLSEIEKELALKKQEVLNLRQSVQNKVVMEEMIHDLKVKLAGIEDREKQIPLLKAKTAELEIELKKWLAIAADFSTEGNVVSLRNYIESLQEKELSSRIEMNNLNAVVRSSENKLSALQYELENLKQNNEKLENALQKTKVEVQVLRKKSILVTRERDSYRQQLDLYEKDLTVTSLSSENLSNEICSQMKERIKTLEDSLEDYRRHVDVLESQLKEYQAEDQCDNIAIIQKLKEEVKSLEQSNKVLSKFRDELESKLESRAMKGEYLSPSTKVIHFRDNPVAEAQRKQSEEMQNLREECDKLRARVKLLESGEVLDITQKVGENIQFLGSEKIKELEKELESANLKMQRLKEGYRKTSQEFCDQTKNGTMEMLGTPFAESLSKLVDEHLHKGNSIPAFLAAVTLSLYSSSEQSEEEEEEEEEEDDDEDGEQEPPEEIELD